MTHTTSAATQRRRRSIRSGIAGTLAAIALASAIGCSGADSTGPGGREPVGPYGLLQIEQRRVPAEIFRGAYTVPAGYTIDPFVVTVTGGELVLQNDGEIEVAIHYTATGGKDELSATDYESGTYEIQGDQIVISSAKGGGTVGSYRNGTVTLMIDVMGNGDRRAFVFRRGR